MSTHRHFDKICVAVLALTLVVTVLFMNGAVLGINAADRVMGYENRLFDTSRVHTIDIVMDDWDGFIATCENEEYVVCAVVIDGESYKNVGIRAKGNTSLSQVSAMNSDRYSFKIEFDRYDSTESYHGLDKLCLNNTIQDTTYMKDYLTYQLMEAFDVDAPLSSYVDITVNGEDWGLYLAVEGVEESFLQRNYGRNYGNLYKPDSIGFGGGRGNGQNFNFDDFAEENGWDAENLPFGNGNFRGQGGGFIDRDQSAEGFDPSAMFGGNFPEDFDISSMFEGNLPEDFAPSTVFSGDNDFKDRFGGMGGGFGGMGGGAVQLQYIDDDPDSYANIFENAKTSVSSVDRKRLIESLKKLSNGEDLESVVDIDEVLRYFIVHNFVVNGDSYTGSMVHNYYLYEENGQFSMIPWDYNLAFGTFQGNNAKSAVNDPIDTPLSVDGSGTRPMADWIFSNEEYTELYHQYFSEFLSNTDFAAIIDTTAELIAPYVEKNATAFYSYEAFETGIAALHEFCLLRAESIQGQLDGTIPSTDAGQSANSSRLIDASALSLSSMGSMSMGGMGGNRGGNFAEGRNRIGSEEQIPDSNFSDGEMPQTPEDDRSTQNRGGIQPNIGSQEDFSGGSQIPDQERGQGEMGGNRRGGDQFMQWGQNQNWMQGSAATETSAFSPDALIPVGISMLVLLAGILIALKIKH